MNVHTGSAFKLNRVGAGVWRQLDGVHDVAGIVADLQVRYCVEAQRWLGDAGALFHLWREVDGAEVVTVEGLATDGQLEPLQQAFLDHGAAQCGFCIPGQLVAARALLDAIPHPTRAEVEDGLAGNLCRCAGYEQIIEAVLDAAERSKGPAATPGRSGTHGSSAGERSHRLDPAATPDARVAPQ